MSGSNQSVRPKTKAKMDPIKEYSGQYKSAGEYADALRSWMIQLHQIQCIHSYFPYFMAQVQAQSLQASAQFTNNNQSQTNQVPPQPARNWFGGEQRFQNQVGQANLTRGELFIIPAFWKRVVAEFIDFLILLLLKLAITVIAIDVFDLLEELQKYDFNNMSISEILTTYKLSAHFTSDLLLLESINRIGNCLFEALCLHRGPGNTGGATPGKRIMGLRVVHCEAIMPATVPAGTLDANSYVLVFPSSHLGFGRALIRSVLKNFTMTFLFPMCFAIITFHYNRTPYDVFAGSVVVQLPPRNVAALNRN